MSKKTEEKNETVNDSASEKETAAEEVEVVQEDSTEAEVKPIDPDAVLQITVGELEKLKAQAAKAEENRNLYVRQVADLENYKKRAARDRLDAIKYANEGLIGNLLPVLDSFDMAVAATQSAQNGDTESLKVGINMILTQFKNVMKDSGVEELDAAGQVFDPAWQEAMSQQETDEVPEGHVLQQLRKGYKIKDRLIRPASVIVAKRPGGKSATMAEAGEGETQ